MDRCAAVGIDVSALMHNVDGGTTGTGIMIETAHMDGSIQWM